MGQQQELLHKYTVLNKTLIKATCLLQHFHRGIAKFDT